MSGCSNKIDLMAFSFVPERNLISNGTKKLKYKIAVLNILYLQLSLKAESSIWTQWQLGVLLSKILLASLLKIY